MASSSAPPASFSPIGCPITEKLAKNNFPLWKAQVLSALRGAQVAHFLNADASVPPKQTPKSSEKPDELISNPNYETWVAKDQQIFNYLLPFDRALAGAPSAPVVSTQSPPPVLTQRHPALTLGGHGGGGSSSTAPPTAPPGFFVPESTVAGSPAADSGGAPPGSFAPASPAPAVAPRPITRLQQGIRKPKTYTDGTIRYGHLAATSEEPHTLQHALADKNWKNAMDVEFLALQKNKTWHLRKGRI